MVWIIYGLLWCFYQLFGLSFWRHPFTVEDPLVSKWCNATFLQICSDEETNSSTSWMAWGWVKFQRFWGQWMFMQFNRLQSLCAISNWWSNNKTSNLIHFLHDVTIVLCVWLRCTTAVCFLCKISSVCFAILSEILSSARCLHNTSNKLPSASSSADFSNTDIVVVIFWIRFYFSILFSF